MESNPRVLMFGWEFPPHNSGGLGVACAGLVTGLIQQSVPVTFVLPKKLLGLRGDFRYAQDYEKIVPTHLRRNLTMAEINSLLFEYATGESYDEKMIAARKEDYLQQKISMYAESLMQEVHRYGEIANHIARKEDFDIIHAHDWLTSVAALEAKQATGKPMVVHIHATEFDRTGGLGKNEAVYEIEQQAMETADAVVAVSHYTKAKILEKYRVSAEKIHVVHNGIQRTQTHYLPAFEPLKKAGYKIVIFVGRLTLQKGPDYFLEMAHRVLKKDEKIMFFVAGYGDMYNQLLHKAAKMGIADKVLFAGFLRGKQLGRLFQSADLFIMPSVSEPFGLVALEAIQHGTPALVSRQSGVAELLDEMTIVDFWDTDKMVTQVLDIVHNSALTKHLVKIGRSSIKAYTWESAAKKCLKLYTSLVTS